MVVHTLIEASVGYPGLWLACAGSGIFVPMPEDVPLMYAGTQIASETWAWPATLVVAWLGVATRDLSSWAIGRFLGRWLIASGRMGRFFGASRIERAQRLVTRHGSAAVLMGRFMVGFRTPVFVTAGAMGVPLRSFAAYDALGLTVAIPIAVGLGFWFGAPIAELAAMILQRTSGVVTVIVLIGVAVLAWRAAVAPPEAPSAAEDESS